jgi:hypothetical protein
MIREQHGTASGDREQRAELERLQGELAQVRRATAHAEEDHERVVAALQSAISAAELERANDEAKVAALEQERRVLEPHLEVLRQRLDEREKEEKVLALGASRRDIVFVPTNGRNDSFAYRAERIDGTEGEYVPMTTSEAERAGWKALAWMGFYLLVIIVALIASVR